MNGLEITSSLYIKKRFFMYGRKMRKLRDSRHAGLIFLAFVSNILINRQRCEVN